MWALIVVWYSTCAPVDWAHLKQRKALCDPADGRRVIPEGDGAGRAAGCILVKGVGRVAGRIWVKVVGVTVVGVVRMKDTLSTYTTSK